jgi:hypothetical protein
MNSKKKGGKFERLIGRELSLWITEGKSNRELIRSVGSGGWQPTRRGEEWRHVGDLAANGPVGELFRARWAVECKHHAKIDIGYSWWTNNSMELLRWWRKLSGEIKRSAAPLLPMVVFRANGAPIMVALPASASPMLSTVETRWIDIHWHDIRVVPLADLKRVHPARFLAVQD